MMEPAQIRQGLRFMQGIAGLEEKFSREKEKWSTEYAENTWNLAQPCTIL
jgi:hypothetical protein